MTSTGDAADLLDEIAEKLVELRFVGDLKQFAGELDLVRFRQNALTEGLARPLGLAECSVFELFGLEPRQLLGVFHLGAIDVVHDRLLD